ncbi:MAG: nucleotidyltransferase domain-containing protein [Anaerolineae bacterium]|nr:nucleotidyltransferase domain-containing protein [Anaerolineae bacterium]MCB9130599.1 nucleotidyltransferase domain-containing protein [Anaerolineales bacterium]MCB0236421.1 nucleotidyltransferase domain-containing protein [Anaerolineae bacterium]MCB0241036.1 nucleotidyltransferase domain-containing protein [Anaerolineae bacterium]MCB0242040.1 nucleotidyltransferase domain-containing protein [Anaerolineae bacterium]
MTTPDAIIDLSAYKRAAVLREQQRRQFASDRRAAAWLVARKAGALLTNEFGANRVLVFGSLAHGHWFGPRSDIDLAASGIPADLFWRAWSALDAIGSSFEINLIALETATASLRTTIEEEGVEL